jgi:hypothetical protein
MSEGRVEDMYKSVCVKKCPAEAAMTVECVPNSEVATCPGSPFPLEPLA